MKTLHDVGMKAGIATSISILGDGLSKYVYGDFGLGMEKVLVIPYGHTVTRQSAMVGMTKEEIRAYIQKGA